MDVTCDSNNNLLFNRKIKQGMPKIKNYGIVVARKIINNNEFWSKIKQPIKFSRYNKRLKIKKNLYDKNTLD